MTNFRDYVATEPRIARIYALETETLDEVERAAKEHERAKEAFETAQLSLESARMVFAVAQADLAAIQARKSELSGPDIDLGE